RAILGGSLWGDRGIPAMIARSLLPRPRPLRQEGTPLSIAEAITPGPNAPSPEPPVYVKPPAPRNRLGPRWLNHLTALPGLPWQRRLSWGALQVPRIRAFEARYDSLSDDELKTLGQRIRGRARGGESLDRLLPEAFGLVCVAAKRRTQMRPFDVQLAAGIVMHNGALAELATGEGKTLCASM